MRTYENADGTFTLFHAGKILRTFNTQLEAVMKTRKLEFAQAVRAKVTEFDNLVAYLNELRDIFQDSGYASGGGDPITDEDLEALGMTTTDLANFDTFVENVSLFLNNGVPMQFNYAAAINRFRSM